MIVVLSLAIILHYALTFDLSSDASREYAVMLAMMDSGTFAIKHNETTLISCLFTTYIPGLIATQFNISTEIIYRLFPCLFIMWTPLLVYLIVRRYVSPGVAFVVALFFMGQNYYLWSASLARIGIAVMFFALAIYCLTGNELKSWRLGGMLIVCAAGIVFAHYGTTFVTIALIGLWLLIKVIGYTINKANKATVHPRWENICFLFLIPILALSLVWHGIVFDRPMSDGMTFAERAVKEIVMPAESVGGGTSQNPLFAMGSRESVIQVAFGATLSRMNIPQRIEFVFSWLMILMITFGVGYSLWKREQLSTLALAGFLLLVWTVLSPYTGLAYGIARVYFQCSVILLSCLGIGLEYLGSRSKVPAALIGFCVAVPYILCTSGIMHSLFGLSRWQ